MSVPVECTDCGGIFEVGLGDEAPDLCNQCARVESRLADGGQDLGAWERAAAIRLFDVFVPDEGVPFSPDDGEGRMVWSADGDGFEDVDWDGDLRVV